MSPTKRLVQMKNASEKAQIKAASRGGSDQTKLLYNVSPTKAYLVQKEDISTLTRKQKELRTDDQMTGSKVSVYKKQTERSDIKAYNVSSIAHNDFRNKERFEI